MNWALIGTNGAWLAGPLDEEPPAAEGERAVMLPLGWPETMVWSPERDGFVDVIAAAPEISVGRFKLLFSQAERIAIRAAAVADPVVDDFLDVLAGFATVSLSDPVLIGGVNELEVAGLIAPGRAAEILAGASPA